MVLVVVLLLIFLYAPVVPVQCEVEIAHTATRAITVTLQGYASMSYYIFGVGTAPFDGTHAYRTTVNGTEFEFYMHGTSLINVSMGALPLSKAPMADVRLQLLSDSTLFSGPTLTITFRATGNSNITVLSIETSFSGLQGQEVNIAPNTTETVSFVLYTSSQITLGATYPVSIYGQIANGSVFRYYTSVESHLATIGQPTIKGTSGPVWLVGAMSTDPSALPNTGVRSTIEVVDFQTTGSLAFWVSDGLPNQEWGQVGYFLSGGGPPIGFYQVWNLTSDTLITRGTISVDTGNHTFSMYLQNGTTWAYAIDGNVFATYDMGASSSSLTYPVYAMSEEQANTTFSFPAVSFGPALEILRSGSWSSVQSASVYGTTWGVEGSIQNNKLGANQMIVSGSLGGVPQGTLLWGASIISSTSDSLASFPVSGPSLAKEVFRGQNRVQRGWG
jgi:hypothetical protein